MRTRVHILLTAALIVTTLIGCGPKAQDRSGFLSDYTKLQKDSKSSLRYLDKAVLKKYPKFIIDPIETHITKDDHKLTPEQVKDLESYMYDSMVKAVLASDKKVAYVPAEGVARLRIALTDIDRSHEVSMLPQATLLGAGLGGASVEAEIVDSMTGQQIGALVQSKKGSQIPFTSLGNWTAAKQVINTWAKTLQKRLSE